MSTRRGEIRSVTRSLLLLSVVLAACSKDAVAPPTEEPAVRSLLPAAGSRSAAVSTTIEVQYSLPVSLPQTAALILVRGNDTIRGALTQQGGTLARFEPADVLDLGATYTARITGVRSILNSPMSDTSWTFTTAGTAPGSVDGTRMQAHVQALAHDSMRGRGSWTADELRAAQMIAVRMQQAGLSALNPNQWLQNFVVGAQRSQNVYGVLRGTGALANEWVIIGGHYDHVGVSSSNGQIFNGADDNASGTAGVLELARVLAAHVNSGGFGDQPRRSVLFIAFGAEEAGLHGSNFYCANPLVDLTKLAGMINLDMIGRLRNNLVDGWTNTPSAGEWTTLLQRYRGGINVRVDSSKLIGTDYRCFAQMGKPAVALFTGTHSDYHQPTDDAELINVDGMAAVGNVALGVATNLMLRSRPLRLTAGAAQ